MDWKKIRKNKRYYLKRAQILLKNIDLQGKSVLDLGCGEMIIKKLAGHQMTAYTGIDEIAFQLDKDFICGNIFDHWNELEDKYDVIIALGVLDHLDEVNKQTLVNWCSENSREYIVLSHCNPESFLLNLFKIKCGPFPYEHLLNTFEKQKIYGMKIPLTQWFFELKMNAAFNRKWATEKIIIIQKKFQDFLPGLEETGQSGVK